MFRVLAPVMMAYAALAAAESTVTLQRLATVDRGLGQGTAEITAFDPQSARAFVCNARNVSIDILNLADPANPAFVRSVDLSRWGAAVNSVDVAKGVVAVAVAASSKHLPGRVVLLDTEGRFIHAVEVGTLPDMLTFTADGSKILVANEGEPCPDYTCDPEGSVSIVDLSSGAVSPSVTTVSFADFNAGGPRAAELPPGVRVFGPRASVAMDLEPEYIALSPDGRSAWVTLQENNAIAVVDIQAARVERIFALGWKDFSLSQNKLDASDKDGGIHLRNWPVRGLYLPDAVALYTVAGIPFLVTANEGESRTYAGFDEERRVQDVILDPRSFPNATKLRQPSALGRLKITSTLGDADGDGDYDALYAFGARSFAVWNALTGALVFDSGSDFEKLTAALIPERFNASGRNKPADTSSDAKGPEPEGIAIGTVGDKILAFIGLETTGGVMVYDLTDPVAPQFLHYEPPAPKDDAPEGLEFVEAKASPTGQPLLLVANEGSGTVSIYQVMLVPRSTGAVSELISPPIDPGCMAVSRP